jgi:hypothetical protein
VSANCVTSGSSPARARCRRCRGIDQRFAQHLQAAADAQHRPPAARAARTARVQALRAQPGRSPLVCLEPGRIIQSAPASSAGVRTQRRRTPGTFFSGWNSSRLLMRG